MKTLRQTWFIALKDLKIFSTDRTSIFFFIVFPFMFMVLFNFIMGDVSGGDSRLTLYLTTQEPAGGISQEILGAMQTTDVSHLEPGQPEIVWLPDYEAARAAVDNGTLDGFIAFPADFTEALNSQQKTDLLVYTDPANVNYEAALSGLASGLASEIMADEVVIKASIQLLIANGQVAQDPASINQAVQGIMSKLFAGGLSGGTQYITYQIEDVGNVKAVSAANFVIPGYLVMFVFFAAAISAEAIVRERTNHTMERLLSTSVKREAILGGIFTGTALKGIVQIIIFWAVGILAFNVDLGISPAAVFVLSILMVIMSSAFALMLATLAQTARSASSMGVIASLVLAPLGGCWWPVFLYPQWLQNVAKISPHAWATTGFNKLMLYGADFGAVVPEMLALLAFAVVFGVIAVVRFRTSST